jgi:hypothetical protein
MMVRNLLKVMVKNWLKVSVKIDRKNGFINVKNGGVKINQKLSKFGVKNER